MLNLILYYYYNYVIACLILLKESYLPKRKIKTSQLDEAKALFLAIEKGDEQVIKMLIAQGIKINNIFNEDFKTPLMVAALKGNTIILKELIASGANVHILDKSGNTTALMEGAEEGHLTVVRELIACGANVNQTNIYEDTVLAIAAIKGHLAVVRELIINGAEVNKANQEGETALLVSVTSGNNDIFDILVANGADVNCTSIKGCTPLMAAVLKEHLYIVTRLLALGVQVDQIDEYNRTSLILAVRKGNLPIVTELVLHGANILHRDIYGFTPLMIAAYRNEYSVMRALITKSRNASLINEKEFDLLIEAYGIIFLGDLYSYKFNDFKALINTISFKEILNLSKNTFIGLINNPLIIDCIEARVISLTEITCLSNSDFTKMAEKIDFLQKISPDTFRKDFVLQRKAKKGNLEKSDLVDLSLNNDVVLYLLMQFLKTNQILNLSILLDHCRERVLLFTEILFKTAIDLQNWEGLDVLCSLKILSDKPNVMLSLLEKAIYDRDLCTFKVIAKNYSHIIRVEEKYNLLNHAYRLDKALATTIFEALVTNLDSNLLKQNLEHLRIKVKKHPFLMNLVKVYIDKLGIILKEEEEVNSSKVDQVIDGKVRDKASLERKADKEDALNCPKNLIIEYANKYNIVPKPILKEGNLKTLALKTTSPKDTAEEKREIYTKDQVRPKASNGGYRESKEIKTPYLDTSLMPRKEAATVDKEMLDKLRNISLDAPMLGEVVQDKEMRLAGSVKSKSKLSQEQIDYLKRAKVLAISIGDYYDKMLELKRVSSNSNELHEYTYALRYCVLRLAEFL
ncbi:MAG: ankyrin, partial [Rickettsiaceae bacterium]|nr:ankyrin [Rickettsiaceae bacterium]